MVDTKIRIVTQQIRVKDTTTRNMDLILTHLIIQAVMTILTTDLTVHPLLMAVATTRMLVVPVATTRMVVVIVTTTRMVVVTMVTTHMVVVPVDITRMVAVPMVTTHMVVVPVATTHMVVHSAIHTVGHSLDRNWITQNQLQNTKSTLDKVIKLSLTRKLTQYNFLTEVLSKELE
jgi:hypothetical protein